MPIFPHCPRGAELCNLPGIALVMALVCITSVPGHALAEEHAAPVESLPHTNRLIDSNNPYLLLHAHNPVDWYPWGPEALEKAKREHKPIFLSVGYSTCYWCRVAEETIYSRQEFADPMNAWFVNIKVDREQRPDIDRLYMAATQAMTGRGGWPNNVFLTPDLKPFFGGSYFPPHDDAPGRPGFDSIIRSIHASWTQDPERLHKTAEKIMAALRDLHTAPAAASAPIDPRVLFERARAAWVNRADHERGGFGAAKGARFPQQPVLSLLMADPAMTQMGVLTRALDAMAAGGIYDHLAGGFHRYASEPTWSIPHFEKTLGDNAQLLAIYAKAFMLTGDPRYRLVAMEVADYLTTQMMAPEGGFYTAQDAAVNGKEGLSYLWTRQEIVAVLGGEAAAGFFGVYELTPMSGPERLQAGARTLNGENPGVLRRRLPIEATRECTGPREARKSTDDCTQWRMQLLEARSRRLQPARDEKRVVALNGLAIQAFARAGTWLEMLQYIEAARRTAETMWNVAYHQNGALKHEIFNGRAQTDAFPDDYALLGLGFIALYDASADTKWLQRAGQLADDLLAQFQRADGSLATTTAEKDLPMSPPEDGDDLYPSGSSATIDLLLRLDRSNGATRYADAARGIVDRLGHRLEDTPEAWPALLQALAENDFAPAYSAKNPLDTQAVVRVSAVAKSGTDRDEVVITLQIADGYHVNANPASYDYLIATSVAFGELAPTRVLYPEAILFKPSFAPAGLKVYEGKVTLEASFPKGSIGTNRKISAVVSAQACNSEICLPPAQLTVTLSPTGIGELR
jgi:uncharacterized protein YyaL (SSP411 family)